ncbi:MAG: BON domain-containing protein [Opitutae bacterium]|nr:BON domain-containing protein [Opitutae bacterium]
MHLLPAVRLIVFTLPFLAVAALRAGILEDRDIEDAIERSYVFREVLIDRSMVQLYIRHGAVELRGQVADERERDLLVYMIANLRYVEHVDNRLFVDSAGRRAWPNWRAARIRSHIQTERDFDATNVQIASRDGALELTGTVRTDTQRLAVAERVRLLDAERIPLNRLQIDPTRVSGPELDDASVAAMVRCALEALPVSPDPTRKISSRRGEITITGAPVSSADAAELTRHATAVRGVTRVVNRLATRE